MRFAVIFLALGSTEAMKYGPIGMPRAATRAATPVCGLMDMFKESPEQKRIKDQQLQAMKDMQAMRRDPEAWEAEISKRIFPTSNL